MAFPAKKERYTFADVLTWGEDKRIEIMNGEAFLMATPSARHQEVCFEIGRQLGNFLEGKSCRVYPAPFGVRLFEQDGDRPEDVDTLVEPDISVICDTNKIDDRGCNGAPDWVIEITSPSNPHIDYGIKLFKYRTAGVKEYWIVNPKKKTVTVFDFEGYEKSDQYSFDDDISVCIYDDLVINITDLLS